MGKIIQPLTPSHEILAARDAVNPIASAPQAARVGSLAPVSPVASVAAPSSPTPTLDLQPQVTSAQFAPSQPVQPVAPASIYPTPTNGALHDVTPYIPGVPLEAVPVKQKLPVGVYVIAGLSLLTAVDSFMASGSKTAYFWAAVVVDTLLAVGLLTRSDLARRIIIVLGILGVIGSALALISFVSVEHRFNDLAQQANTAVAADERATGRSAPAALKQLLAKDNAQRASLDHFYRILELREGVQLAFLIVAIAYLTRPKVADAFV